MIDRLARLLVALFVAADDRESVAGDINEARQAVEQARGRGYAKYWYLRQAAIAAAYGLSGRLAEAGPVLRSFRWPTQNIRYALRSLFRTPAFAATAVLSLAVGIGATTAMFGLVYAVLLQPLALPHPDQIVVFERTSSDGRDDGFSRAEFDALKRASTAIDLSLDRGIDNIPITILGEREYVTTDFVSGDYFRTLGLEPRLGRLIDAADEQTNARVLVIAERMWQRQFHGDSHVIGSTVDIKGTPFTVIGVTPASFRGLDYPGSFAAAIPASAAPAAGQPDDLHSVRHVFNIVGRLKDGGNRTAALGALDAAFQRCCPHEAPEKLSWTDASHGIGGKDDMRDELRGSLVALLGAVVLVLVMACLNVANLLMVRGEQRGRELALRMSLGASRGRVVGQLATESALLAAGGGTIGLGLAAAGRMLLSHNLPRNVDVMAEVMRFHIDAPVVICTLSATAATVLVAGVIPAVRVTRVALSSATKMGDRATVSTGASWFERGGVVMQVALALLLVTTASLLAGTFARLAAADPGIRPSDVYVSAIETRGTSLESAGIVPIHAAMLDRVRALPGVEHAGLATYVPFFGGRRATRDLQLVGAAGEPLRSVVLDAITPEFFASTGIPLLKGRDIDARDAAGAAPVAILSESVAQKLGGGLDVMGKQLRVSGQTSAVATIVGIARDARLNDIRGAAPAVFYMPVTQTGAWPFLELTVRAPQAPAGFDRMMSAAIASVAPEARVRFQSTLETELAASFARERFAAALASIFAIVALALSAMGLYGLMTQHVARRRTELGVRVALGARAVDVIALVAHRGAVLVAIGLGIGLPLALVAGRLLAPELYGLRAWEPSVFLLSVGVLSVTAALALAIPARRAARTDPLTALKDA